MDQKEAYPLIITSSGERAYFEVLDYVYAHYSIERGNEITLALLEYPNVLKSQPYMGQLESHLSQRSEGYRFLVYKRTLQATVKIIYYVDEATRCIYITDFFATEMSDQRIKQRS